MPGCLSSCTLIDGILDDVDNCGGVFISALYCKVVCMESV